jgi:hypothetical protein
VSGIDMWANYVDVSEGAANKAFHGLEKSVYVPRIWWREAIIHDDEALRVE